LATPRRARRYGQATRTSVSQGVVVREVILRIIDGLLIRFERQFDRFVEFRDRRHYYKGRAERGLAVILVVGALAALGALTAVALTTADGGGVSYLPPSTASSASFTGAGKPKVVTVHVDGRPAGKRDVVDLSIRVSGGGSTGQSGACKMGIARALVGLDGETFPAMRDGQFLTRDSRMKERKHYGLRGARRGVQFSKR